MRAAFTRMQSPCQAQVALLLCSKATAQAPPALKTAVRPIQASHDTAATRWHSWPLQRTHNRVLATLGVVVVSAGEPQKSGSGGDRYFDGRAMAASSQNS
jgi:hypothetical protein